MTEERLEQYKATKLEIAQLESKIRELRDKGPQEVTDSVTTAASFPYSKHTVVISGIDVNGYQRREERMHSKRAALLERAQSELEELENYIATVPDTKLRVIMRYKYIDGFGWLRIAYKFGWHSESAPRLKVKKYLRENENNDSAVV